MGILRCGSTALRSITHKERQHGSPQTHRLFAQLSQAMLKVEQPAVGLPRQVAKDPVINWLFPATLALLGLSFSTFCTHQLVATSDSRSLALSAAENKGNTVATGGEANSESSSKDGSSTSSNHQ